MRIAMNSGLLAAALLAATGSAFTTIKQEISTNFAQAEVQHAVTIIRGELEPCVDDDGYLIVCPTGQYVHREFDDGNLNCPCRYAM
jgi:hypothetical protein